MAKYEESMLLPCMKELFKSDSKTHHGLCVLIVNSTKTCLKKGLERSTALPGDTIIEEDVEMHMAPVMDADTTTTTAPPWGLDRIDQRQKVLDSSYSPPQGLTGEGVHVFEIGRAHV